jgi:hypothetical protein
MIETPANMLGGAVSGITNKGGQLLGATYNYFSPSLPNVCDMGGAWIGFKCQIPRPVPSMKAITDQRDKQGSSITTGPSPSPLTPGFGGSMESIITVTEPMVTAVKENGSEIVRGLGKGASSILTGAQQTYNHRRFGDMVALCLNIIWVAFLMLEAFGSNDLYTFVVEIVHAETPQQKAFVRKLIQFLLSWFSTLALAFSVIFQNLTVLTFATFGFILITTVALIGLVIYFMFMISPAGTATTLTGVATGNPNLLSTGTGHMMSSQAKRAQQRAQQRALFRPLQQKMRKKYEQAIEITNKMYQLKVNIASLEQALKNPLSQSDRSNRAEELQTNKHLLSTLNTEFEKLKIPKSKQATSISDSPAISRRSVSFTATPSISRRPVSFTPASFTTGTSGAFIPPLFTPASSTPASFTSGASNPSLFTIGTSVASNPSLFTIGTSGASPAFSRQQKKRKNNLLLSYPH